jgi:hypothetical protein
VRTELYTIPGSGLGGKQERYLIKTRACLRS